MPEISELEGRVGDEPVHLCEGIRKNRGFAVREEGDTCPGHEI